MSTQHVGSTLQAARLRQGEELADVAAILRIRPAFLQAIERGQYEALPGVPYAIGFVRTYAEHLGLDGAEIVRQFKSEAAGLDRKTSLSFPSPAPEGRVPGTAALLISLVAATVVFGGWYLLRSEPGSFALRVPEVPERLAGPIAAAPGTSGGGLGDSPGDAGAPADATAPTAMPPAAVPPQIAAIPPAPQAANPAPGASPAASTRAGTPLASDAPVPPLGDPSRRGANLAAPSAAAVPAPAAAAAPAGSATPTETEDRASPAAALGAAVPGAAEDRPSAIPPVPQVAAAPSEGRIFGAQNGDSRVVIKAHGESWVQVRDTNNTALLTRVLRPGDSYRVPNKTGLTLMTGNAGVLDIYVDGTQAPAVGAVGAVRRNISLDAERLRSGGAVAE